MALLFDIPLTLIGIRVLGPRFGFKTVLGFSLTAIFNDTLTIFWGYKPLVEGDVLLSSIFGGVLVGLGLGLMFKSKATSGGSDIVAAILNKYTNIPIGQLMILVDSVIVLLGLVVFGDWKIPLYSWIVIFITGKVIDVVMAGISYDKSLFIISDKHEEIRDKIIHNLNRGGTLIEGKGCTIWPNGRSSSLSSAGGNCLFCRNISTRSTPCLYDRDRCHGDPGRRF